LPRYKLRTIHYSSSAQRNQCGGKNRQDKIPTPGAAFKFDPRTDERFDTRMLISASPKLPPRTTRFKLELDSGPSGFANGDVR
jgi:hypothetical protein